MKNALRKLLYDKYLLLVVLLSILVLSLYIDKPFIGLHDFNGVQEGNAAKNYLRFGITPLRLGQIISYPRQDITQTHSFYTSYLPTLSLTIATFFRVFGIHEWVERLVPASFSTIGVTFFFITVRKLWGLKTAILSSIFYILTPMYIYFGKMPVFDPVILGLSLVVFYFYFRSLENKNSSFFWLYTSTLILGLYGWIGIYVGPLIIFHSLLVRKFHWRYVIPTLILSGCVLLQIIHAYILLGFNKSDSVFSSLIHRLGEKRVNFGGSDYSLINYLRREISIIKAFFTNTVFVLSGFYITRALLRIIRSKVVINSNAGFIFILLLYGLAHPVIFSKAVFIHEYQNIYLLPFLSLTSSLGLLKIADWLQIKTHQKVFSLIIIFSVVIFFSLEKIQFTKTLLQTSMNKQGKEVAGIINRLQKQPYEMAIVSSRFNSFYGIFADFYINHPYSIISEQELIERPRVFKYILTFDEDVTDRRLYGLFLQKYNSERIKDITIFNLDE